MSHSSSPSPVVYHSEVPNAPKAVGPYSIASGIPGITFLSGQIPLLPETGKLIEGDIEAQTEQVLKNITAVLTHLQSSFHHVVKTTIFLTDLGHFSRVNAIYERHLQGARPARSTIQVAALPLGAQVEIEMIIAQ